MFQIRKITKNLISNKYKKNIFISNIYYSNILSILFLSNLNMKMILIERTPFQELSIFFSLIDSIKKKIMKKLVKSGKILKSILPGEKIWPAARKIHVKNFSGEQCSGPKKIRPSSTVSQFFPGEQCSGRRETTGKAGEPKKMMISKKNWLRRRRPRTKKNENWLFFCLLGGERAL